MILIFASSLYKFDSQINLIKKILDNKNKKYLIVNPLNYKELINLQLKNINGKISLYFENMELKISSVFFSRKLRTDCILDIPNNFRYTTLFRQKIQSFLMDIIFFIEKNKRIKHFPSKHWNLEYADSKINILKHAVKVGLSVPDMTINSILSQNKNTLAIYRKSLSDPFSITYDLKKKEETAITLFNRVIKTGVNIYNIPWQWQSYIETNSLIRCIVVGNKVWSYKLNGDFLFNNNLREVEFGKNNVNWEKIILPFKIKTAIQKITNKLNLEFCCPEFIENKDGRYIFTDLNPYGDWFGFGNESDNNEICEEIISKL